MQEVLHGSVQIRVPSCVLHYLVVVSSNNHSMNSHPLALRAASTHVLSHAKFSISFLIWFSLALWASAFLSMSGASVGLMTTTPSESPTIMSPGLTTSPPHMTGKLISPPPSFS